MSPPAAPPMRLLFWEATSRCNLGCVHCRRLDVTDAAAAEDLTTDEVRKVLASTARLGRPIVVFSGGEPLLRDDWEELAGEADSLSLPTALATNGTLIDADVAARIRRAGFRRVSISLDGADAATHDAFRGVDGAFGAAVRGAEHLRRADQPLQINASIAARNREQLDEMRRLALDLGAAALHLFLLVPVGCGATLPADQRLSADDYERVLNRVCDWREAGGLEVRATCAPHYYRVAAERGMDVGRSRGCLGGIAVAFVSHRGEVFPCGYLPVSAGSVRERELEDIWRDARVFADLRDYERLKGKCGACEHRGICGGCRARAYAATGDYLAAEPACTYRPVGQ